MSYRAIYLGDDEWAVRKFENGVWEKSITLHVDDPQLRSSDRKAIDAAIANSNEWVKIA